MAFNKAKVKVAAHSSSTFKQFFCGGVLSPRCCSFRCVCRYSCLHLKQRLPAPRLPSFLWLSVYRVHFKSERFNQTGEKGDGESSFLSDTALRSAGFQEKRDFPFFLTSALGFFRSPSPRFLFPPPLSPPPPPCVYPLLSCILLLCPCFLFSVCSLWVWLKVTLHTGSLSEREGASGGRGGAREKGQDRAVRIAEEEEGEG